MSSGTGATEATRTVGGWRLGEVIDKVRETASACTILLDVPDRPGHRAGQHVDVRLTAEDGYQAQRSYSIASGPEDEHLGLTVERLDDGEVSPYLVDELRTGDRLELRGPIGGWFVWAAADGGPLLLVAGGSGLVPLIAMLRHRAAVGSAAQARLLLSARTPDDVLYGAQLKALAGMPAGPGVVTTFTRRAPPGWSGYARRVDRDMLAEVAWKPATAPRTFVCGPTSFVEGAAAALVDLGHDPRLIKTERFGPTGS